MTEIVVTQAAVRKLAALLSKTNTVDVRHGDRLDLIASAFGWKTDAFMHALKGGRKPSGGSDVKVKALRDLDPVAWGRSYPIHQLGILQLDVWLGAADNTHGVLLVSGCTGSGRSTTLASTARHLEAQGRRLRVVGAHMAECNVVEGDVVLFGEIRDKETASAPYGLAAQGALVLASMARSPYSNLQMLEHFEVPEDHIALTRGVIHQYLVRKVDEGKLFVEDAESRYRGRVLVSAVEAFDHEHSLKAFRFGPDQSEKGLLTDLCFKVARHVTDLEEVSRVFGQRYTGIVKQAVRKGLETSRRKLA